MITGNDLIELGYKPSKWFSKAIKFANIHNLKGEHLQAYLKTACPPPFIEPFKAPLFYHQNILPESREEVSNLRSVIETMSELMKTPTVINGAIMPDACPTGEKG